MRWPALFVRVFARRNAQADLQLDEEIRSHLAMAAAERVARGESAADAGLAARREFGNVSHVKEVTRETWGGGEMERLSYDVRHAVRALRRSPVFAATAAGTLALGIAANTAMFTIVRSVLLRPLPFANADALYVVSRVPASMIRIFGPAITDREYAAFAARQRTFVSTAAYHAFPATLLDAGDPARIPVAVVTPSFFATLGVAPRLGRGFDRSDGASGAPDVAVISAALWRDRFGGDSSVIGKSARIEDARRTIVGVMPDGFEFPRRAQAWLPVATTFDPGNTRLQTAIGRLRAEETPRAALASLEQFGRGYDQQSGQAPDDRPIAQIVPLRDAVTGDIKTPLFIFSGAVGLVLLIACVNVSNLLLMRAAARRHEMGIRAALGAGRARLVRMLLVESLVIALIGGAAGYAMAAGGLRVALRLMPPGLLPRAAEVHADAVVALITLLVCAGCGVLAGALPALAVSRRDAREIIGGGTRATERSFARGALVTLEAALSLLLLVGAGLTLRSFSRLTAVDLGFKPDHVIAATVDLPESRYRTPESVDALVSAIDARLRSIPRVRVAGVVNWLPLDSTYIAGDFARYDRKPLPRGFSVLKPFVSPGYFETLGIRLIEGRGFLASDGMGAEPVAIVSQATARRLWPEGALGQRIAYSDKPAAGDWITIVGVAADVARSGPSNPPMPAIYRPIAQSRQLFFISHLTFVARVDGTAENLVGPVRATIHAVDAEQPIRSVATMESHVHDAVAEPRFRSIVAVTFSALALLLAAVGVYGVLAYSVSERTRELGIRLALGASPRRVARAVFSGLATLVVPGVAVGVLLSLGITRLLSRFLFDVRPSDPVTYLAASVVLLAAAAVAGVGPARRAARVDPSITMK
jgi:putative ABC transport system permease protein